MKATVEWDGYNWVAVPEGGGVTQAKRLDQLPGRIVEVVKLMTGTAIDADDVDLDIDFPRADEAIALRTVRSELAVAEQSLIDNTKSVVIDLRDDGVCLRDIAHLTGISHQRAQQLIASNR